MTSILRRIFDVFSKRPESSLKREHRVPETTRTRVVLWCREVFGNTRSSYGSTGDYTEDFWREIHRFLRYRHGRGWLTDDRHRALTPVEDAVGFLMTCQGEEFLDFVEYIFRVDCFFHVALPEEQVVAEMNELLRQDELPYHVTNFVKERIREVASEVPFAGREVTSIRTVAYPKVIMRESEVLHTEVVVPALQLLGRPAFRSANAEYLAALEDYRKGDYGDSLTKCGSAFESVLKVLCERKGWPYRESDTASTLVKTVLGNMSLENYFESVLMIVATLRNRLSTSHGAGALGRNVPRHLARYALNATASAIVLLAEEAGES